MNYNRIVNDTVYGHIPYTKLEEKFLQSRILNRLLFISQNALAYFAFPSISTKRYIHSLGTMHVASYMFKNALMNSYETTSKNFLYQAREEIERLINKHQLKIELKAISIKDKTLLNFSFALEESEKLIYMILLQALRLAALLHDVGHLPFSHQTEYALKRLYLSIKKIKYPNEEQKNFLNFYKKITNNGKVVLHESIGNSYLTMLFHEEVMVQSSRSKELIKLYYLIVKNIFNDKKGSSFSYAILHQFIASTVDADRIDYINRDLLASGNISSSADFLRITRETILVKDGASFKLAFLTSSLSDIEHLLESRFNLYKKVFFTSSIARLDTLLEKVITYLSKEYLLLSPQNKKIYQTIAMMWKFSIEEDRGKKLDIISQLDENWLISLFKKEYFKIKYQLSLTYQERYYLAAFEDILFGKHIFKSNWKNLSEFYNLLALSKEERYAFREKFGSITKKREKKLEKRLNQFIEKYNKDNSFYAYSILSLSTGIDKEFSLYDGRDIVLIDELSTVRKRLNISKANSVPFFIFSNRKTLTKEMKQELKEILFEVFL